MTKLCDFKRDNPPVLTWLKICANSKETRTQVINCTTKFFYNKALVVVLLVSH